MSSNTRLVDPCIFCQFGTQKALAKKINIVYNFRMYYVLEVNCL